MAESMSCDIAVIGAGAGGIALASGAAVLGARVILIERGRMGGNRLHGGDIALASLLAAGRHAVAWRTAERFGIRYDEPDIDFAAAMRRAQTTIAELAPNDSAERLAALGVTVLKGEARFTASDRIAVGDTVIHPRHTVIASGSRPAIPPIRGLESIPCLTTDTVFTTLTERPLHLLILGGGPSGIEMAQAFRRLGTRVTLVERLRCLNGHDPELAELLTEALVTDGVVLHQQTEVTLAEDTASGIVLTLHHADGSSSRIAGSHLLLATGRVPNVESLDLPAAGVTADARGIAVSDRMRSSHPRIWAIGDVAGQAIANSHAAQHQAAVVLKNILFRLPARCQTPSIAQVVYGDPELASVGLSETEARARHGRISILRAPFATNDRAQAEGRVEGMIKVIATARTGRILGAAIAGPQAADLIQPWQLAIAKGLGIGAMQALAVPHPSRGESGKRAATDFYRPKLFSPLRGLVQFLARFD
jgi:pyruvate/2-oxoglutarate dehydrogenase complex dihydrolipoamide dehydrogenase (E3) component